jgi:hypothetical protein
VAVDFSHYLPPGVYTNPTAGPQLAVNSALPRAVGLVGTSLGYRTFTETVQIPADTVANTTPAPSTSLQKSGIDVTSLKVKNLDTGFVYQKDTHYTISIVTGVSGSSTAKYCIKRFAPTPADGISQLQKVQVSYQYTDPTYYSATTFYDYSDVTAAYGEPYKINSTDNSWSIQSEVSLGAKFAFLNGAYSVVCAAVKPPVSGSAGLGEYTSAFQALEDEPSIAVVVPCNGDLVGLQTIAKSHVDNQSNSGFERRAIVGVDGSKTTVGNLQRIIYAVGDTNLPLTNRGTSPLLDRRVMMVSPSSFTHSSAELNMPIDLGGQFMAASLAGMTVSMSFAQPLTHKHITGWIGISDGDLADYSATSNTRGRDSKMSNESSNGLCVIENTRRKAIRVRHGVSTDPSNLLVREWSITGQEDALVYRLRDYIDDANLIGQPIYNYTLINVKASAEAALQSLVRDGLLVDYTGLTVRQLLTNPDVLEISFGWKPAFPLNYIVLTFAISLSSGNINNNSASANPRNVTSTTQITAPNSSSINDFGGPSNTLNSI